MNTRQRFHETLEYGTPDRFPFFDYGIREGVLERWRAAGLPPDADVRQMFSLERWETAGTRADVEIELRPIPRLAGRLHTRADWQRLRDALDPTTPGRYPNNWAQCVADWRDRDHPLGLVVWRGLFLPLQVGEWETLTDLLYLMYDDPDWVSEMVAYLADFDLAVLERALTEVDWDFAVFEEPIASNSAPVISPAHYRRFCVPHLRRIVDRVRTAGIELLVIDSQGAVGPLIPLWLDVGLNTLWLGDVAAAGLDYRTLRRQYGPELRLLGGLDLRVMTQDRLAVTREVLDKVPPLLAQGGYIPFLDGRVRKGMPFENYALYRQLLQSLAEPV
jgi:uroporphyrinogen decarboxylase